jgi:hypothetical protein
MRMAGLAEGAGQETACSNGFPPRKREPSCARMDFVPSGIKEVPMIWKHVEGNWRQVKGRIGLHLKRLSHGDTRGQGDRVRHSARDGQGTEDDRARREVDDWFCRQKW